MSWWLLTSAIGAFILVGPALREPTVTAQQIALADRRPRFLFAPTPDSAARPLDVSRVPALRRQIALDLEGAPLAEALAEITRETGLAFVYSRDAIRRDIRIHLRAEQITVAAALTEILLDAGVDVLLSSSKQAALVKRHDLVTPAQEGAIVGQVTDRAGRGPLVGAMVLVEGTRHSATTGEDGRYRMAGLVPGAHTVRARYIGYLPGSVSVTVGLDQEATADFALEKSAQQLDEVVTTGTLVPTEVKALPTPVSVISEGDIEAQRPRTLQELFRQVVPAGVSWDLAAVPYQTTFSVRGATTSGPAGQMKVFVDGIEVASPSYASIDPNSVGRVEVIRGPQAAAIYGSDAIGGVIQVFTKRGDAALGRPQVDAEAALGVLQTPYAGFNGVLRQSYKASVGGGGPNVSYNFGAGYSHTGDYLPNGEVSEQSNPSVYGGMRFARGILTADVSGRYYTQNAPSVVNPELVQTGFFFYSKPLYQPIQVESQALGARIGLAATSWWRSAAMVGVDRVSFTTDQTKRRLTTPADTLLFVSYNSQQKLSIGFNTSVQGSVSSGLSGSLTAGFDHYSLPNLAFATTSALGTTGIIQVAPGGSIIASRTTTNNTGYFAQLQVGVRDALFITGGVRAEENTDFGDSLGTPVSPRAGLAYVQRVGGGTLKLRGSYGRAIRAPSPGAKFGAAGQAQAFLANPLLGPERQKGWDAGLDAIFGRRGSISVTFYDQTADNLIQTVLLQSTPVPTFQNQNVGRVKNTGIEVEGALYVGPLTLKGQYGYARARIDQLPANYAGDLRVGDQALLIPKHTAGASVMATPFRGTTVAAGLTYAGSWTGTDYVSLFRCFGGSGPCQPTPRDYLVTYPGFVKLNATVAQQLTPILSGFVSVSNITNNDAFEALNITPVTGRVATAGFRLHY